MVSSADVPLIILLVVALLLAVFLAAAEASLLRISEVRARSLGASDDPKGQRVSDLAARLPQVLNLILFLALLAQIGSATITGVLAQRWFGNLGVTIASIALTVLLFVYGEAIPKTYAVRNAETTAKFVSGPIALLERVLRPFVSLLVWIADIQLPGPGINTSPTITEDELKILAGEAVTEGEITEHDRTLIERAFRFGDRRADDIMVPRPDIVAVSADDPLEDAIEVALASGHRRLPVYSGSLEHIVGVVRLRDLVAARNDEGTAVNDLVKPHLVVPESKRITGLLADMQEQGMHLAVVVDEYGVTVGLVTIEDVAEELLGSISDEPERPPLRKVGSNRWIAEGSLPVEDLSDELGVTLPDGDWNTVAGMVLGLAGKLPSPGDHIQVDDFRIVVDSVEQRRITEMSISRVGAGAVDQAD